MSSYFSPFLGDNHHQVRYTLGLPFLLCDSVHPNPNLLLYSDLNLITRVYIHHACVMFVPTKDLFKRAPSLKKDLEHRIHRLLDSKNIACMGLEQLQIQFLFASEPYNIFKYSKPLLPITQFFFLSCSFTIENPFFSYILSLGSSSSVCQDTTCV